MIDRNRELEIAATGLNASPGAAVGAIVLDAKSAEERGKAGEQVILVRWETTPDDYPGMHHSQGILTAHGGITSHAAVVARGEGKPCVVGCEALSIDLEAGTITLGDHELSAGRRHHDRRWHGRGDRRCRAARSARDRRELRNGSRLGGRAPPA